jgi:hypothetical protein
MASWGGLKSARIRPFEGLAFLISAINAHWPVSVLDLRALEKLLTGGASSAMTSSSRSGISALALATSSRL